MKWFALTALTAIAVLCPRVEALPPSENVTSEDIYSHPGLFLGDTPAKDLTMSGIGIGDAEFRIPKESIVTGKNGSGWIECIKGSYRIDGGKVAEILLRASEPLATLGVKGPSDIELKFGKPDQIVYGCIYGSSGFCVGSA